LPQSLDFDGFGRFRAGGVPVPDQPPMIFGPCGPMLTNEICCFL
jgi:hypothetical protein